MYTPIEQALTLRDYRPPTVMIECRRCRRRAEADAYQLRRRFGEDMSILDIARQVAGSPPRQCGLAIMDGGSRCGVRALQPPVEHWATLYDALHGGWRAILHCQRHHQGLKAAKPCPEPVPLDIPSIAAVLGHDFKLDQLRRKCECPWCHSDSFVIEWIVPRPNPPTPADEGAPVVQLRSRADRALKVVRR